MIPGIPTDIVRANRRGIFAMVSGMALFVVNDSIIKHVSEMLPSGQIIFLRGVMATLLIGGLTLATGAWRHIWAVRDRKVALRACIDAVATFLYLVGLFHIQIANVTAINLSVPLILTMMAAWVLREAVGWRRWTAVVTGFVGVLLVVQPAAAGFNGYALVVLLATCLHAMRDLLTRRIDHAIPSLIVTLATAVVVTAGAAGLSVVQGWRPLPWASGLLLVASAGLLSGGYYLVIDSMRHGELSLVAPFRYTAILWALALGYLVWGDLPNEPAIAGIALLVMSGIYIIHRERVRARELARNVTPPAARSAA